ncbi:MAG: exported protein of unknown function [Nitrospira sp.]|nr:exported protein of unknown function [Nitrospira sp.]MCE3225403.1 exported protein of unknown function [Nitrospira sp.]
MTYIPIAKSAAITFAGLLALCGPAMAAGGTAKGETTDEKGQQGVGLSSGGSSNIIMGGPETIIGKISRIQGEEYSIKGNRGQDVSLRVTKDTNVICAGGKGTQMSTSREGAKEHQEIPPTPHMQEQAKQGHSSGSVVMPKETQKEVGALSKDPSKMKDVVGSTDPKANEDVAKGSGFVVGSKEGCAFKVGDQVKIEASDMGTATTIQQLAAQDSESHR